MSVDLLVVFQTCVFAMIPVLLITLSGTYLTYYKIFGHESNNLISKAAADFFFPVFILVNTLKAIDIDDIGDFWPIFVFPVVYTIMAMLISIFFLPLYKPPAHMK